MNQALLIPVSVGELFDKKTILQIKRERVTDVAKLQHVERELALLTQKSDELLAGFTREAELQELIEQLFQVNGMLWDLENAVRAFDRAEQFGPEFIASARKIYAGNDRRAMIKLRINTLMGSDIVEVKSHG